MTVRIQVKYRSCEGEFSHYATTLGAGGLFISADEAPPVGSAVSMQFQLGEQGPRHEVQGRVKWTASAEETRGRAQTPGFGVQFTDPIATSSLARELEKLSGSAGGGEGSEV